MRSRSGTKNDVCLYHEPLGKSRDTNKSLLHIQRLVTSQPHCNYHDSMQWLYNMRLIISTGYYLSIKLSISDMKIKTSQCNSDPQ